MRECILRPTFFNFSSADRALISFRETIPISPANEGSVATPPTGAACQTRRLPGVPDAPRRDTNEARRRPKSCRRLPDLCPLENARAPPGEVGGSDGRGGEGAALTQVKLPHGCGRWGLVVVKLPQQHWHPFFHDDAISLSPHLNVQRGFVATADRRLGRGRPYRPCRPRGPEQTQPSGKNSREKFVMHEEQNREVIISR